MAANPQADGLQFESVDETDSTHADLVARARAGAVAAPVVRSALVQRAGRGRMGRAWLGSARGSLLFSLALPWSLPPASTPAVSLACGCALADAIERTSGLASAGGRIALKWPNDLLLAGSKLSGILVELVQDGAGRATLVAGAGVNLALDAQARAALGGIATDLAAPLGRAVALDLREPLLQACGHAMRAACEAYEAQGFAAFREAYLARLAWRGERVRLVDDALGTRSGHLVGIDAHGRVVLGTSAGLEAVSGGELRREAAP